MPQSFTTTRLHHHVHRGLNHVQGLLYGKLNSDAPVKFLKSALREGTVSMQSVKIWANELDLYFASCQMIDRYQKIVSTVTGYCHKLSKACLDVMQPMYPLAKFDPLVEIVVNYITGKLVSIKSRYITDLTC